MSVWFCTLNAKYIHSSLALRYLQSYCRRYGQLQTNIKEFSINENQDDILSALFLLRPDILCFSCYIWNIEAILALTADYKKIAPETLIILGGPEVSYDAEKLLQDNPQIDCVIRGEGEATLLELLTVLAEGGTLTGIEGITYRLDGSLCNNPDRPLLQDLDVIPFPYPQDMKDFADKIVYYESSRGCPYNCSYCLSSTQHGVRFFSLSRVKEELAFLAARDLQEIKFVDRTFNCHEERAMEIMDWIAKLETKTRFHLEIQADSLSQKMLQFMTTMPEGRFNLEIGIQSTYGPALQAVNRKPDWTRTRDHVARLVACKKFHIHLDLIAGLPGETYQDFARSFNDVFRLRPDALQLGFLKLLKGSAARDTSADHGYLFQSRPPYRVLGNRYLDPGDMIRLQQIEALLDRYYNSADTPRSVVYIINNLYRGDAFGFFEKLAAYWQQMDYFARGHKKDQYYEYLLDFADEYHRDGRPLINELLKYDYIMNNRTRLPQGIASCNPEDVNQETYAYIKNDDFRRLHLSDRLEQTNREIRKNVHLEYFRCDPETTAEEGTTTNMTKLIFIYDPISKKVVRKIKVE